MTVLVVEDEEMTLNAVCSYLERQGMTALAARSGREALELFEREAVSFVILDLMLPDLSGEEVCGTLRTRSRVPIIMLTARTQEEDVLNGLAVGADDYITKPFSLRELYARVLSVSRRAAGEPLARKFSWNDSDLCVDFEHSEVKKQGRIVALTASEWRILCALIQNPQKVYTREELISFALSENFEGYDRAVDTHIKNLRKKIETDPKNPVYVKTAHGLGYKFGGEA